MPRGGACPSGLAGQMSALALTLEQGGAIQGDGRVAALGRRVCSSWEAEPASRRWGRKWGPPLPHLSKQVGARAVAVAPHPGAGGKATPPAALSLLSLEGEASKLQGGVRRGPVPGPLSQGSSSASFPNPGSLGVGGDMGHRWIVEFSADQPQGMFPRGPSYPAAQI